VRFLNPLRRLLRAIPVAGNISYQSFRHFHLRHRRWAVIASKARRAPGKKLLGTKGRHFHELVSVEMPGARNHRDQPLFTGASRDGFQICPQPWHRQYESASAALLVVVTCEERQKGQDGAAGSEERAGVCEEIVVMVSSGPGSSRCEAEKAVPSACR